MLAPGTAVTVEGLRTNDTYVFAIAAYDDAGQLLAGLGTSSQEVGACQLLLCQNLEVNQIAGGLLRPRVGAGGLRLVRPCPPFAMN